MRERFGTEKALGPGLRPSTRTCLSLLFSYFRFLGAPLLVKDFLFPHVTLGFSRGTKLERLWFMELKVGQSCYAGDELKQTRAKFLRVFLLWSTGVSGGHDRRRRRY